MFMSGCENQDSPTVTGNGRAVSGWKRTDLSPSTLVVLTSSDLIRRVLPFVMVLELLKVFREVWMIPSVMLVIFPDKNSHRSEKS